MHHDLSCVVSCPNVLVLNTNDTVLPASVTASSCQRFSQVISSSIKQIDIIGKLKMKVSFCTTVLDKIKEPNTKNEFRPFVLRNNLKRRGRVKQM